MNFGTECPAAKKGKHGSKQQSRFAAVSVGQLNIRLCGAEPLVFLILGQRDSPARWEAGSGGGEAFAYNPDVPLECPSSAGVSRLREGGSGNDGAIEENPQFLLRQFLAAGEHVGQQSHGSSTELRAWWAEAREVRLVGILM